MVPIPPSKYKQASGRRGKGQAGRREPSCSPPVFPSLHRGALLEDEEPKRQSHIPLLAPSSKNLIAPTGPDVPLQAAALSPQPSQAIGGCFSLLKVLVIAMESSRGRQGQAAVLWWSRHSRPPC